MFVTGRSAAAPRYVLTLVAAVISIREQRTEASGITLFEML